MDSYRITNENLGTTLEIGTWIRGGEFPDFGDEAVYQAVYAQNPLFEGGRLAYDYSGVRKFTFPLRVASGPMSLDLAELILQDLIVKPGGHAYIDMQPETVPSSNQVRFDILTGRIKRKYEIYHQRIARRELDLELDVMPFGYMPTMITLASVGPTGPFVNLSWTAGSIIGDAPALAELNLVASVGSAYLANLSLAGMFWSVSRNPVSPTPFFNGSMMTVQAWMANGASFVSTVASDGFNPGGFTLQLGVPSFYWGTWTPLARIQMPSASTLPGRFRLLAYANLNPSQAFAWQMTADDAIGGVTQYAPLSSAYPVATLLPLSGSWADIPNGSYSGLYQILDLGEHAYPVLASGVGTALPVSVFRIWAYSPTTNLGLATTPVLNLAGIYLLPAEGDYGILTDGMQQPTYSGAAISVNNSSLRVDSVHRSVLLGGAGTAYELIAPVFEGRTFHYGAFPEVGSHVTLEFGITARRNAAGATSAFFHHGVPALGASIRYQPRFTFLKAI